MLRFVITALIVFSVLYVLLTIFLPKGKKNAGTTKQPFKKLYDAELTEIERENARGLLSSEDAEAKKAELGRRILALHEEDKKNADGLNKTAQSRALNWVGVMSLCLSCIGALTLYGFLGSPDAPSLPLAERKANPSEDDKYRFMVFQVEERLKDHPEDGRGWEVLAPVYTRLGRHEDAVFAWAKANKLLGETPERLMKFVEADVTYQEGMISENSFRALKKLEAMIPTDPRVQFYLATADELMGKYGSAKNRLEKIVEISKQDAPFIPIFNERIQALNLVIADVGKDISTQQGQPANPTQRDIEAAQDLSQSDRQAMIKQMVQGLEARLKEEGGSIAEWQRLINSQKVLGDEISAQEAFNLALTQFQNDEQKQNQLKAFAASIGLE